VTQKNIPLAVYRLYKRMYEWTDDKSFLPGAMRVFGAVCYFKGREDQLRETSQIIRPTRRGKK